MGKTVIEEFVARLGWEVDDKGLKSFQKGLDGFASKIARVGAVLAGAIGLSPAFIASTNKNTLVINKLAQAAGMSTTTLKALTETLDEVGISTAQIVRYSQRLGKNLGESGKAGENFRKSLKRVGLSYSDLKDKSPEERLVTTLETLQQFGDAEIAASVASDMFGRGAELLVNSLRSESLQIRDLIADYRDFNFSTESSNAGAIRFAEAWKRLERIISSLRTAFAGMLGGEIAPLLENFTKWIKLNKLLIRSQLVKFAKDLGKALRELVPFVVTISKWFIQLGKIFGGTSGVLKLLLGLFLSAKFLSWAISIGRIADKALTAGRAINAMGGGMQGLGKILGSKAKGIGLIGGFALLALVIEDVWKAMTGGKSFFKDLGMEMVAVSESYIQTTADNIGKAFDYILNKIGIAYDALKGFISLFGQTSIGRGLEKILQVAGFGDLGQRIESAVSESRKRIQERAPYKESAQYMLGTSTAPWAMQTTPVSESKNVVINAPATYNIVRGSGEDNYQLIHGTVVQQTRHTYKLKEHVEKALDHRAKNQKSGIAVRGGTSKK